MRVKHDVPIIVFVETFDTQQTNFVGYYKLNVVSSDIGLKKSNYITAAARCVLIN